jgi:hypothetical protein
MANYELGGDYYAGQLNQQNPMGGQQQSPLGGQQQSPIEKPFDFNALNSSIGNLQTGIDSILTRFDTFKPQYAGNGSGNTTIPARPGGQVGTPGFPGGRPDDVRGGMPGDIIGGGLRDFPTLGDGIRPKGIIDPNFSPYQRNEDLDLTNRSGIMGEFGNYLKGGHGTQGPMPAMSRMGQFMGEEQSVNYANDFGTFLDTFGIRDRLQLPEQQMYGQTMLSKASNPPKHNIPTAGQGISSLPQTGYQV